MDWTALSARNTYTVRGTELLILDAQPAFSAIERHTTAAAAVAAAERHEAEHLALDAVFSLIDALGLGEAGELRFEQLSEDGISSNWEAAKEIAREALERGIEVPACLHY